MAYRLFQTRLMRRLLDRPRSVEAVGMEKESRLSPNRKAVPPAFDQEMKLGTIFFVFITLWGFFLLRALAPPCEYAIVPLWVIRLLIWWAG